MQSLDLCLPLAQSGRTLSFSSSSTKRTMNVVTRNASRFPNSFFFPLPVKNRISLCNSRSLENRSRNLSLLQVRSAIAPSPAPVDPATLSPNHATVSSEHAPAVKEPSLPMEEEWVEKNTKPEKFVWEHNWYPVALLEDLDGSRPTSFQLLGIDLVLWKDPSGSWRAFKDLCPHRLAPLSEGRLDSDGQLQCSYHGWAFRGDGSCAVIPQAEKTGPEASAARNPRACAVPFPTKESQGLLYVWPVERDWITAEMTEPPRLPSVFSDPSYGTVTIQRDLFYGYDTLMENVSDPSHINFAHHKVTGRRDRAAPQAFEVERFGVIGFVGATPEGEASRLFANYQAPCYVENKIELKVPLPILGEQNWEIWICSFNVPMAPGKTRSIVCSARNFAQITVPGNKWWQKYPRWLAHLSSNLVYDGDMIVLQGQEKAFLRGGSAKRVEGHSHSENGNGKAGPPQHLPYGKLTFTPTGADRLVLAFRNWMRRYGGGEPAWAEGVKEASGPLPSTVLSKREMMDRHSQHTEICSSCRGAAKGIQRFTVLFGGAAFLLVTVAPLIPNVPFPVRVGIAIAALILAAAAAYLHLVLLPKFIYVDYVHADIDD
eukprot:TRINITY_DN684_c0_g1_i1.p1 TRINITY_DN684_c0_g1~~TRINITY_DN684_c0_g1_i1.p1  ORF type:complete len:600 (-),score=63.64 TRINITY_DN684_c0_g1_i1:1578-3377(-)